MAEISTPEVRFAVIGVGHIGYRHAQLISENPGAELVALIDSREGFSTEDDFAGIPRYTSLDEFILSGIAADVLCVCTPNYLHHPHTLQALAYGLHVVCEKPMALEATHCQEMIAAADAANRHIFCVMQNRYSPPAVWLKEVVQSGVLGQVYHVQVNCFWNRDERYYTTGGWRGVAAKDGGTLFTQFSHFVDMLYWLFGDIQNVSGQFKNYNHIALTEFEDSGYLQFEFENGGFCTFNFTTAVHSQNLESSITIIAENGTVKVGGQYMNSVEYCDIRNYTLPNLKPCLPANNYGNYTGSAANHQFVFENVISTLREQTSATTNAQDGLRVVRMIERMYELKASSVRL
ncbi:Gfo/Idh/MocA family oxidoreductase [uncultured Pontibacter sp.]|uniref:Gfo/Idh/MocA family protein n=1 Tax=uncultured Pontibacter sp. TaxID=453356 RepID=UPI00260401D5|nr:Gfo/Idh/MocA family oxidoreductase [uncultured Pontibacter sp.]